MKKMTLLILAATILTSAFAADNQAFIGIFAETKVNKMVGATKMPEIPPEILAKNPKILDMMPGAVNRSLEVRLWSPGLAPENAFAFIIPPEGLKQGKKMELELYRPKPEKSEPGKKTDPADPSSIPDFTIKIYWGSSPTVKPGQPKIISIGNMNPDQKKAMKEYTRKMSQNPGEDYYYKPDWTTAYWPTKKQPGRIDKEATLTGKYSINTNYTGNVELTAPANVNFLDPFDLLTPKLNKPVPMDNAISLAWKPIPNLLGAHAMITGMEGKNTLILWYSSENFSEGLSGVDWGYLEMAKVAELVQQKVLMKGDTTQAVVPAGIFKNCDMVNLMMIGYGPGASIAQGQPLPRIQTKTTLTSMLGGKMVEKNFKNMGGEEEDDSSITDEEVNELEAIEDEIADLDDIEIE